MSTHFCGQSQVLFKSTRNRTPFSLSPFSFRMAKTGTHSPHTHTWLKQNGQPGMSRLNIEYPPYCELERTLIGVAFSIIGSQQNAWRWNNPVSVSIHRCCWWNKTKNYSLLLFKRSWFNLQTGETPSFASEPSTRVSVSVNTNTPCIGRSQVGEVTGRWSGGTVV